MLYVKYEKNRFHGSEKMSFEKVDRQRTTDDDGRTTDVYLYYKLTNEPSAQIRPSAQIS